MSSKCSQKRLDYAQQSATYALKTPSKKTIHKIAGETGDLIVNKIANKITKVLRTSLQNSWGTIGKIESKTENISLDKEIPKERYISPEEKDRKLLMI